MERRADFLTFARAHRASGDIDPVYPVLSRISDEVCSSEDERVSLVMLYVAYYDLGSALTTWLEGWRPGKELDDLQLRRPTGTERRGHRNVVRFAEHIAGLGAVHNRYGSWERALWPETPGAGARWVILQDRLAAMRGNGRWAAYKTGEMLMSVNGWDVKPTDAGHAFSTGPRQGLIDLYPFLANYRDNDDATIDLLDTYTGQVAAMLGHPVEQVETALCDWHSTLRGHYYVGHDIDVMLTQTARAHKRVRDLIMIARAEAFAPQWRGEAHGWWSGVRKELNTLYRDRGELVWWP